MAAALRTIKQRIARVIFFFPFQLLLVYLKKNHVLLFFWFLMFGYVTHLLGRPYGIPYLFLGPEYLNRVDVWAHLIIGFACGGFIMAFNISSYIINGFRFPFIATLSRPFFKFCLNNFVLPVSFVGVYLYHLIQFQLRTELMIGTEVALNVVGFCAGNVLFILIAFGYFFQTNMDLKRLVKKRTKQEAQPEAASEGDADAPTQAKERSNPVQGMLHKQEKWYNIFNRDREWRIETYLAGFNKIALARGSEHYDKAMLKTVFAQNHINASLFELLVILSILALGLLRESPYVQIPAGATIFLLFTMFMMITSALHSWLKGWSTAVLIVGFFALNYASQFEQFSYDSYVYGLHYNGPKAPYTSEHIASFRDSTALHQADHDHGIEVLHKWRLKNTQNTALRKEKPRLVIVNTTGGGLRSAMWTFHCLTYVDSLLKGELLHHTQIMSGSSGGMIGAAYLRELYLQSQHDSTLNIYADSLVRNFGKDILNPVVFSIATNDLFLRLGSFEDNGQTYTKDRGYTFEKVLNQNTNFALDKRLGDYFEPESNAEIPTLLMAPTISNDGRRLLISSQPISYMTSNQALAGTNCESLPEAIEYRRFFQDQQADSTWFTSTLRMNATFPLILPNASLPTEPQVTVLDAGIRDNFGLLTSLKYLFEFRNWISSNTSGVVFIQIRDKAREFEVEDRGHSIMRDLGTPLGAFYSNWENIQKFNQDQLLQYASLWFDGPIDVVSFELKQDPNDKISLSWHLTAKEKRYILRAIQDAHNDQGVERLRELLQ